MFAIIFTLLGSFLTIWALFKYIILIEIRLDANTFKTIYDLSKKDKKFILQEEFITEAKYPVIFSCLCFFNKIPWFYLSHGERLLTAGYQGKDYTTTLICFRWRYRQIYNYLKFKLREMQLEVLGIPVEIITPWFTDKIGSLKCAIKELYLPDELWKDIDQEAEEVFVKKTRLKTSALLYGPPGNSKTYLVKYLAVKYKVPIKVITFSPDWSNIDLMFMFSQITQNCIVLLEDFDNYFDGRNCIIGNGDKSYIKFTFDVILNCLDGVYNTYENVMFIMTANDINKIDFSLKNRPSRFKYVRKFDNPSAEIRNKLLPPVWSKFTEGLNLDQILRLKEFYELKISLIDALKKLEKELDIDKLKQIAYNKFEERNKYGLNGTPKDDWYFA